MKSESYFVAETAFHHQGDYDYQISLIDAAKSAGFNGIKFQILVKPDDFLSTKHSQYAMLKNFCFSRNEWKSLIAYANNSDLDVIVLPLDKVAIELVQEEKIKYFDIHSVSFNDQRILRGLKNSRFPIMLSVGGRTLNEISELKNYFDGLVEVLMVGFQGFPSKIEDVKLEKILLLKERFKDVAIGYADHSSYDDDERFLSNYYARTLGATCFEKHITLNVDKNRVDYNSAMSAKELSTLINKIKFIDGIHRKRDLYTLSESEQKYRDRQLKVVAISSINSGEFFTEENVGLRMIDIEGGYEKLDLVLGKICNREITSGSLVFGSNIGYK